MRPIDEILADMRALLDGATGRNLTDAEIEQYDTLEAELSAAQAVALRTAPADGDGDGDGDGGGGGDGGAAAATALTPAARAQRSRVIRARDAAYNTVVNPAGRPRSGPARQDTLDRAFGAFLRTGQPNADIADLRVRNAQGEGTGAAGGYLVPDGFRQRLIDRMKAFGGLANVVDSYDTETGNTVSWPTLDDTSNEGEVVDESGTFTTGADLQFGQGSLGAYRYATSGKNAAPLRLSVELLQDAVFDVESIVSGKLGQRLARIQAQHWVNGTGVKQPQGIIAGKTGVEIAVNTAVTYLDLLHFVHSVDPAYRENGRWAFNDGALETIRGIEDDNGRPILKGSLEGAETGPGGETLLGYPVTVDQAFPNINKSSNTVNWGVFGDLTEAYVIRRVRDVAIIVNPWTRASYGEIEYSAWARADGIQQNANAYAALTGQA